MNGNAVAAAGRTRSGGFAGARQGAVCTGVAEGRRGQSLVATEGLGELRRLAVADALGDLAHGQAVRGEKGCSALHANPGQMFAEGRASDLRIGALQLAARG